MGQGANSGRHASLDDKKERARGRQQNDPANEAIRDRHQASPVPGAFGRDGRANRQDQTPGSVAGDSSGSSGGAAAQDVEKADRTTPNAEG